MLRENDPDRSPGPRLFVAGCAAGCLAFVRHDLPKREAAALMRIVRTGPLWCDADAAPAWLDDAMEVLHPQATAPTAEASLIYRLPHGPRSGDPRFVHDHTASGDGLLAKIAARLPRHLRDAGFLGAGDFWPPWCAALDDGEIAAVAFAARLGDRSAEVGIYTFPRWRGRGLAAAVTAEWASLPALAGRRLFYSTAATNLPSRRVAARLGLQPIGAGLRID